MNDDERKQRAEAIAMQNLLHMGEDILDSGDAELWEQYRIIMALLAWARQEKPITDTRAK